MNASITWVCKYFNDLSLEELYAILRLRSEVFVVEQNCVFLDQDNNDQDCYHLMGFVNNEIAAYTRLLAPGKSYDEMSIGRVVTSPKYRGQGSGKQLMTTSIDHIHSLFGKGPIKIGAQLYLKKFYESFGFEQVSEVYDEDGIDHIKMLRK